MCKSINRSVPVSVSEGKALFFWDKAELMWAEAMKEEISSKRSSLMLDSAPTQDRFGHHSKLCFVGTCRVKLITGSHWTRHLRGIHSFTEAEVKVCLTKL